MLVRSLRCSFAPTSPVQKRVLQIDAVGPLPDGASFRSKNVTGAVISRQLSWKPTATLPNGRFSLCFIAYDTMLAASSVACMEIEQPSSGDCHMLELTTPPASATHAGQGLPITPQVRVRARGGVGAANMTVCAYEVTVAHVAVPVDDGLSARSWCAVTDRDGRTSLPGISLDRVRAEPSALRFVLSSPYKGVVVISPPMVVLPAKSAALALISTGGPEPLVRKAGQPLGDMHVLLLDGFGNPTGEDGVQLMLYAMPRTRSVAVGGRTAVSTVGGRVFFFGPVINVTGGPFRLEVGAEGIRPATTPQFWVVGDVPSALCLRSSVRASVRAGDGLGPVLLEACDRWGNPTAAPIAPSLSLACPSSNENTASLIGRTQGFAEAGSLLFAGLVPTRAADRCTLQAHRPPLAFSVPSASWLAPLDLHGASSLFAVTAGKAARLQISPWTTTDVVAGRFTPPIGVSVRDSYGNIDTEFPYMIRLWLERPRAQPTGQPLQLLRDALPVGGWAVFAGLKFTSAASQLRFFATADSVATRYAAVSFFAEPQADKTVLRHRPAGELCVITAIRRPSREDGIFGFRGAATELSGLWVRTSHCDRKERRFRKHHPHARPACPARCRR
jgi:hypothetical protein